MTLLGRCLVTVRLLVVLLLIPGLASAQGTPVPLPTGPGGTQAPVYVPGPIPGQVESPPAPVRAPAPASASQPESPTSAPAEEKPEASAPRAGETLLPRVPQPTAFPELTKGVGNSERLLEE